MSIITIKIEGPVQCGKSSVLQSIRGLLEDHGYCVAIPDRCERKNPSKDFNDAASHERPHPDRTVFVLEEILHA